MTRLGAKGDPTTTGGVVISGSSTQYDEEGRTMAVDLDFATCGVCSDGPFQIFGSVSDWTDEGRKMVRDLDLVCCPCRKNRVLARGSSYWIEERGSAARASASVTPARSAPPARADEQVRIVAEDGRPMANCPFHIRDAAGKSYQGLTDESGLCPRVYTDRQLRLDITVGLQALQRWNS